MKSILIAFVFVFAVSATANAQWAESITKRSQARYKAWHWYELSDEQYAKLVKTLSGLPRGDRKKVTVACADPNCHALAEDIVDAFDEAKWDVKLNNISFQTQVGLWCSGIPVCAAVTAATGIKTHPYDGPKDTFMLVFGPKK